MTHKKNTYRGMMIILSSPSGAGKTTISNKLLLDDKNIRLSISYTTRPAREKEINGRDYYFITENEFITMKNQGLFLEYAKVFDNYYGTLKSQVKSLLDKGHDVLFDIDWQGAQQIELYDNSNIVSIFILPPSYKELQNRLQQRAQDSKQTITKRMNGAMSEISHWSEYNYVIINKDINIATQQITHLISSERLKRFRQPYLKDFVQRLNMQKNH